jgi:hypothetical protein
MLSATPFSKDEAKYFDSVLSCRNLLVHHGGIFTQAFLKVHPAFADKRKYADSLTPRRSEIFRLAAFIESIAAKTTLVSKGKLKAEMIAAGTEYQRKGVDMLDWDTDSAERPASLAKSLEVALAEEASADGDVTAPY